MAVDEEAVTRAADVEAAAPAENGGAGNPTRGQVREEGLRWFGDFYFRPFFWFFGVTRMSPNVITILGMGMAVACGYFLSVGSVPLAAVFFALSGILDLMDGYVAKKLDRVTEFGSFLDSFSDRVSDAAIYLGIALLYMRRDEGVYVGLAFVLLVVSFLISYTRAKAEALGVTCKAGLMARAPRFLAVGLGLFFNGLSPWVLRGVLWAVSALMVETLVARLMEVWKALDR